MEAELKIVGRETSKFKTTVLGEYWRILLPGSYILSVSLQINKPDTDARNSVCVYDPLSTFQGAAPFRDTYSLLGLFEYRVDSN